MGGLLLAAGTVGMLLAAVTLLTANRQFDRPLMFGAGRLPA